MTRTGELFNLVLGACALGYSFMPPERVRSYHRSVALAMRALGIFLVGLALMSLLLSVLTRHGN